MLEHKTVLIITYYWPPSGGPGVQRWLKFANYLPHYNITPVVYCPSNANYPLVDKSLENDISTNIKVIKRPITEPQQWFRFFKSSRAKSLSKGIIPIKEKQSFVTKLLLYIRGNFFIPDSRKLWVKPSVRFLKKYIQAHNILTVITTGPPHSMHLIGKQLKKTLDVKWIADFRDPWTTIGYHKELKLSRRAALKHKQMEFEVLNNADQLIVTSNITKSEFENITNKPVVVITNGYDFKPKAAKVLDDAFTISHIGSLLSGRNPKPLWRALSKIIQTNPEFKKQFKLQLVGAISDDVIASLKAHNLISYTSFKQYVPHDEALQIQKQSQVLLLIEINSEETQSIIPGKLFEYIAALRPILAIGPRISDVKQILNETRSGVYADYSNQALIETTVNSYFKAYLEGKLKSQAQDYEKYSRIELTKSLSKLL